MYRKQYGRDSHVSPKGKGPSCAQTQGNRPESGLFYVLCHARIMELLKRGVFMDSRRPFFMAGLPRFTDDNK
jgi:hypothetical protein